jgi:hypothetical protein
MCDGLTAQSKPPTQKKSYAVELSVSKALLPNLLELIREWLAETKCKAVKVEQWAEAHDVIVLRFSFAMSECAGGFRHAFVRS